MGKADIWDEIEGIGELYVETELVVGVEPVLFVCTVGENTEYRYLVMTYDSCEGIYVMRKISAEELLDMLENRVTMEETFRRGDFILKTYIDECGVMCFDRYLPVDFDGQLLPRKNEFFELHSRYILDYAEKLKIKKYYYNVKLDDYSYQSPFYKDEIFNVDLTDRDSMPFTINVSDIGVCQPDSSTLKNNDIAFDLTVSPAA